MSTRSSRAARRRRRRRREQTTESQRQLYGLAERFRREAQQRERARQQASEVPPSDPEALARELKKAEQHAAMLKEIARVKAREEQRARRDWEQAQCDAHEPMTGCQWSPRSGRSGA